MSDISSSPTRPTDTGVAPQEHYAPPEIPALLAAAVQGDGEVTGTEGCCRTVLRYLARVQLATTAQVIERCWTQRGRRSARHAHATLRTLETQGLLRREFLDRSRGRASMHVVALTVPALRVLAAPGARDPLASSAEEREWRLQISELLLVREVEGWHAVSAPAAMAAALVQARAAGRVSRHRQDVEAECARLMLTLQRMRSRVSLLVRDEDAAVRFVVAAHPSYDISALVADIGVQRLTTRPTFELLGVDGAALARARAFLTAWASWKGLALQVHEVPSFRARPSRRGGDAVLSDTGDYAVSIR